MYADDSKTSCENTRINECLLLPVHLNCLYNGPIPVKVMLCPLLEILTPSYTIIN